MKGRSINANTAGKNPTAQLDSTLKIPTATEVRELKRKLVAHLLARPKNDDVAGLTRWKFDLDALRMPLDLAASRLGEWKRSA